jgi:hypothetical protein
MPGIYAIINHINGKFYIGSTVDLNRRKTMHFSTLRHGRHHSRHLQNAWDKYGEINFVFEILEECWVSKLDELEQWYVNVTRCYLRDIGYNVSKHTRVPRISFKHGRSPRAKRAYQFSKTKDFIREWESVSMAADHLGVNRRSLYGACKRNGYSSGFYWSYLPHGIEKQIIYQLDLEGKILKSKELEEWREQFRIGDILHCCSGRQKSAFGFQWCYRKNLKNISKYSPIQGRPPAITICQIDARDNKLIRTWYGGAAEVERELGINNAHIISCCKKRKKFKTAGGFIWQYASQ